MLANAKFLIVLLYDMVLLLVKTIATSGFLTALECTKFVFGRNFAPDPTGGAYSAPPDLWQGPYLTPYSLTI